MITILLSVALPALQRAEVWAPEEKVAILVRPLLGLCYLALLYLFVRRTPWPRPFRLQFALLHVVVGLAVAGVWVGSALAIERLFPIDRQLPTYAGQFFVLGCVAYAIATGIFYSVESTARAARAEALASRTQLAALRAQLHPHFLFNALHTVVQLIPVNPTLAMEAAELVADLLRSTLEEQRDEVSLADEWRFVSRYLAVEHIRFGKRLVVRDEIAPSLLETRVPAFAVQTLVENAIQHGATPRVGVTEIVVAASGTDAALTVSVRNTTTRETPTMSPRKDVGAGASSGGTGTGLSRLRERLTVMYGGGASLTGGAIGTDGYEAVLVIPQRRREAA